MATDTEETATCEICGVTKSRDEVEKCPGRALMLGLTQGGDGKTDSDPLSALFQALFPDAFIIEMGADALDENNSADPFAQLFREPTTARN